MGFIKDNGALNVELTKLQTQEHNFQNTFQYIIGL